MSRIYNINTLKKKRFVNVEMGEYEKELGALEGKCTITAYGPSGCGKTTYVTHNHPTGV